MNYKKVIILLVIVTLLGCNNNSRKKISLVEVDDTHIGAVSADDKDVYYASYEQEESALFPTKTWIKKCAIAQDKETEIVYEFEKARNVSYLKSIKGQLVMVVDDLKTDKICIYDGKELHEVGEAPVGEINPSYSDEMVTWLDIKKGKIYKLNLDSREINTVDIKDLAMNQYERPFNFENKTYFFQYKESSKDDLQNKDKYKDTSKDALKLVALDWTTEKMEVVIADLPELDTEEEKPTNIKVNASYIIWQKNSRKNSLLFVYDREKHTRKSYSQDDFGGFIKHTALIGDRVYVFDESGNYGIGVLDLKKESVIDIADTGELEESTSFMPIFPYWTKEGFVSIGAFDKEGSLFMVVEGR